MRTDEIEVALAIAEILEGLGIPYLVGGSVASSLLGVPRATIDVDLVADLRVTDVPRLVSAVEADYYVEAGSIRSAITHRSSFNLIHLATMVKVDIFVLKNDALAQSEWERRSTLTLPGEPPASLQVASAEDMVIQKLIWYRLGAGASDRQWQDVLGVLRVRAGRLDIEYLRTWAAVSGVSDLLEAVLAEAGVG